MQCVSPGKFLFELADAPSINHIVVFLTGERPFEGNTGASIYCTVLEAGGPTTGNWKYLGVLTNEKPSAIFKLGGGVATAPPPGSRIEIGMAIEPLAVLEQLHLSQPSRAVVSMGTAVHANSPLAVSNLVQLAQKIGAGMFNYMLSFARPLGVLVAQMDAGMGDDSEVKASTEVVPVQRLQEWFNGLVKRATNDPEGFRRQYLT